MKIEVNQKITNLYLVGNPNSGKSSIFNIITGLNQKTGNFSGVTVEKKEAIIKKNNQTFRIIDLPGTFGLGGIAEDKLVTSRILLDKKPNDKIIFVIDAVNLERGLLFLLQIIDLGFPVFVVLTMKDLLQKKQISIDLKKLEQEIGIRFLFINSKYQNDKSLLTDHVFDPKIFKITTRKWKLEKPNENFFQKLSNEIYSEDEYIKNFYLLNFLQISSADPLALTLGNHLFSNEVESIIKEKLKKSKMLFFFENEILSKSIFIKKILSNIIIYKNKNERGKFNSSLDKFLLHPVIGSISFLFIMGFIFQMLFNWSEVPMNLIENFFQFLGNEITSLFPVGPLTDLLKDGILAGVGSVLVFIPQIGFLFFFIGILEKTGYIARVSYLMDRLMGKFGLSGNSFIALLSASACAVPAIMSTRTIKNKKEKLLTILVTPLITCSARYPVYILIISVIFPTSKYFGINIQGLVLFLFFILGLLTSMLMALIFKNVFLKYEMSYFLMELPEYKIPSLKNLLLFVYQKLKSFVTSAGKIILLFSIILWFLSNYPKTDDNRTNNKIENSYIGQMGKMIEPLILPLGFDWKIGIGLLTSFAAREILVSTLSIIYGSENNGELISTIQKDTYKKTGKPVWSFLTGASLLVFFAFACQCFSTLAITYKETNSIVWPIFMFFYMFILAYISSFLIFQLGNLLT